MRNIPLTATTIANGTAEERINDIATALYYDWQIPYEDDVLKEAAYGKPLWRQEQEEDPWERLALAVIAPVIGDYLEAFEAGNTEQMHLIGNWFKRNDYTWEIFQEVKRIANRAKAEGTVMWLSRFGRYMFL